MRKYSSQILKLSQQGRPQIICQTPTTLQEKTSQDIEPGSGQGEYYFQRHEDAKNVDETVMHRFPLTVGVVSGVIHETHTYPPNYCQTLPSFSATRSDPDT